MIRLDCGQGSKEWMQARSGIPTASQFHRIITPKTMKRSGAADGYLHELLAEHMIGQPLDTYRGDWMDRGSAEELAAIRFYELDRDLDVDRVGFCMLDDRSAGCSPDGLVGAGGLEIKCPSPAVHVGYLLDHGEAYKTQVQGGLWITGCEWWDFLSYHPLMPPALVRFERDEAFISLLAELVEELNERLRDAKSRLGVAA